MFKSCFFAAGFGSKLTLLSDFCQVKGFFKELARPKDT